MQPYDPASSIWPVDPDRLDLAREFRACIRGPHSEDLRRLLYRMRTGPLAGKYVLLVIEPYRQWAIGRLGAMRGAPIERVDNRVFTALDDAEWAVFALRWRDLTGRELSL
jgi:hypothetical protein